MSSASSSASAPPPIDPSLLDRLPPDLRAAVVAQVDASLRAERAETARLRDQNAQMAERHALMATRHAEMAERVARLEHLIAELRRARFGRSSEKLDADQMELAFEDVETAIAQAQADIAASDGDGAAKDSDTATSASRPRRVRRLPENLPREERVIAPDDLSCPCGCGDMVVIGEDRSERLDVAPARFRVIVMVRPRYALP